jgi:capsular polysaccharide biosynthesis protein
MRGNMTSGGQAPLPLRPVLVRGIPLALLTALVCAALAYALSARQEQRYEASSLVLVREVGSDPALGVGTGDIQEGEGVATEALLITSRSVLRTAARRKGVALDADELEDSVTAEAVAGTNIVRVTAAASSAEQAAAAATGVAKAFVAAQRSAARDRARTARRTLRQQYDALNPVTRRAEAGAQLLERIQELRAVERLGKRAPRVAETARVPEEAKSPQPVRDAALGGLFGLLLGSGLAVLWVATGRRPERPEELERAFGTPVLAALKGGLGRRSATARLLQGADAQSLRLLHARLRRLPGERQLRSLALTPVSEREDVMPIAWRLAAAAAAGGERVLVLDGEGARLEAVRCPSARHVSPEAGDEPLGGLERVSLDGGEPGAPGFDVASRPQRGERFVGLVEAAADEWELVILPTPSVLGSGNALDVLTHVDGVILVVRDGGDEQERVPTLRAQLDAAGARVLGVVLEGR